MDGLDHFAQESKSLTTSVDIDTILKKSAKLLIYFCIKIKDYKKTL